MTPLLKMKKAIASWKESLATDLGGRGLVVAEDFIEDGYGEDDTIGEEEESGLSGPTASIVHVLGEY